MDRGQRTLSPDASSKQRRWRLWQVEPAVACNLWCVMCPWIRFRREAGEGVMCRDIWAALRPHLAEVRSVDFTGGGEPLLQPNLAEWISASKSAGCEAGFLTNGLLLTREIARRLIDAGTDWIGFSVDGATPDIYEKIRPGADFKQVCETIETVAALRVEKIPRLLINFVIMAANAHQMEGIVELAVRCGVDQVIFKQCDVIREKHGKGLGLYDRKETREIRRLTKLLAKARRLAEKRKIETSAFSFLPDELPVCDQDPRDSLFIRHDGYAAPCINLAIGGETTFLGQTATLPTVHYGRLPDQSLPELWETDSCRFFRNRFQHRVVAHDAKIVGSTFEASLIKLQETFEAARAAMPKAPEGCSVCHYLYGV